MKDIKKVTLIGLGAMGVFFAPRISEKLGADFRILADGARKERLERKGVTVNTINYRFPIITPDVEGDPADLVIIAVKGYDLERLKEFLKSMDLDYDTGIEYSICLEDEDYRIIAAGSVEENVLKCIAISPDHQGEGLSGTIISHLTQYEFEKGRSHLLMYTKPKNQAMFEDLGFYTILKTDRVLFMENKKTGFTDFMEKVKAESPEDALKEGKVIGAIVANCNPFTLGHRYLIETALKQCDYLHLFVLSDKRTFYSASERYEMVKEGVKDLDRVILHQTSDYIISAATFPTYFMKEKTEAGKANCRLDLELFGKRIAPELHITKRFVGTEPNCAVTDCYNVTMKEVLPGLGIEVTEIQRKEQEGTAISASRVRQAVKEGKTEEIRGLVPESTWEHISKKA